MDTFIDSALQAQLDAMEFAPPQSTEGRLSVADLFPKSKRRGLYVLHAGDQHYLGRTENVVRRYHKHLANHPDVAAISFRYIPKGDLHSVEQQSIRRLEALGVKLRNSAGMSLPIAAGSDLDDLVSLPDQERWRAGKAIEWSGRSRDEATRMRQERKWQKFRKLPQSDSLLQLLEQYVQSCIIAPGRTEMALWSVTCFPEGGFRVNASWQEVFRTIDGDDFFILVAPSVLEKAWGKDWMGHLLPQGVRISPQMYKFPGHDNAALKVYGIEKMRKLLDTPEIIAAARELSWRCMRKAPNPNSRSHCPQLVDFLDGQASLHGRL